MSPQMRIKKQRDSRRKKFFRNWHRRLGFTISIFIFNLAITGLLLNHYESLSLHTKYIQGSWLLDWYGVKAPTEITCSKSTENEICQLDQNIYLRDEDVRSVSSGTGYLLGLVKINDENYLITNSHIVIYDQDFNLIDQFNLVEELSVNILATISVNDRLIVKTKGLITFDESVAEYNPGTLEFKVLTENDIPETLTSSKLTYPLNDIELRNSLEERYRQQQISLLKFVQDLHSGQILAVQGKLLTDLVAVLMILLAISGFITWHRRNYKQSNGD